MKTKSIAGITGQCTRLYLRAKGNSARQNIICTIWQKYCQNIYDHFNTGIGKPIPVINPIDEAAGYSRIFQLETVQVSADVYAAK